MAFRFGSYVYDGEGGRLRGEAGDVRLRPKTFDVLGELLRSAPDLVRHDDLVDRVWQGRALSDTVVAQAISELRSALGDDARSPRFIETVHRRGYRFVHAIHEVEASAPAEPTRAPGSGLRRAGAGATVMLVLVGIALLTVVAFVARLGSPGSSVTSPADPELPRRVAFVALSLADPGGESGERSHDVLLAVLRDGLEPKALPLDGGDELRELLPYERIARLRTEHPEWLRGQADLLQIAAYLGADHLVLATDSSEPGGGFEISLWRAFDGVQRLRTDVPFGPDVASTMQLHADDLTSRLALEMAWPRSPRQTKNPSSQPCWRAWIRGHDARAAGDDLAALRELEPAAVRCPEASDLLFLLAQVQRSLGRAPDAQRTARKAAQTSGAGHWQRQMLERELAGDDATALALVRTHLARHPADADARLEAARLLLRVQQTSQVAALLDHPALGNDPIRAAHRARILAQGEQNAGRPDAAASLLEAAARDLEKLGHGRLAQALHEESADAGA